MNASKRWKFGARIALARAASSGSLSKAMAAVRSASTEPDPSTRSRARRISSQKTVSASAHPHLRPARPYAFVRLAVVMMRGDSVAAAGGGTPGTASR